MQVGDILKRTPTIEAMSGLGTVGPLPCRVIYIHPEGRFYTVEFTSRITGERWREAFWPDRPPEQKQGYGNEGARFFCPPRRGEGL